MHPLTEFSKYLAGWARSCVSARQWGTLLEVETAQSECLAPAIEHERAIAAAAYSAEQSDLEAASLLETAAADGFTNADLPAVEKAIRLIRASARQDHDIADSAAVTP